MHDLEVAICKNEAIGQFEELELGPFLRHPLVQHYFSVDSDTTEVFKITSEEIIVLLSEFMYSSKNKDIKVDEFLRFIGTKRSVSGMEKLGIRIQSLGYVFLYYFDIFGIVFKSLYFVEDWILGVKFNK